MAKETIGDLRESLERLVGASPRHNCRLCFAGWRPAEEGGERALPKPDTLPYFPMVLDRGGFPDGS